MNKANPIRWVIDADIARAAGLTENPMSSRCRYFLEHVRANNDQIVMTQEIKQEWDQHRSKLSAKWLVTMIAKKRMCYVLIAENEKLIHHLNTSNLTQTEEKVLNKDTHLLDAALKTDKHIASGDDTVQRIVAKVALLEPRLQSLSWLNPKIDPKILLRWKKGFFTAD